MSFPSSPAKPRKLFGLLVWKEHWALSLRAHLILAVLLAAGVLLAGSRANAFLTVNRPVSKGVLVIEGWIPVHTVHRAAAVFASGQYSRILIVRPVFEGEQGVVHGRSAAEYAATILARSGVPEEKVEIALFPGEQRDRTYHSAVWVRQQLENQDALTDGIDVVTLGPHSRRSRLLYRKAFGSDTAIGVIALDDPAYDSLQWWKTSEGVRETLGETIGYIYARFFFFPN